MIMGHGHATRKIPLTDWAKFKKLLKEKSKQAALAAAGLTTAGLAVGAALVFPEAREALWNAAKEYLPKAVEKGMEWTAKGTEGP